MSGNGGSAASERPGVWGTALRLTAGVAVLLVGYYVAPLDRQLDAAALLVFLTALTLFAGMAAFEVRGILASHRPRLRAVRTLALGLPLLLVVFAATYCTVSAQQPEAFSEPLSRTDGLYFTMTVFATVGFGDITPATELARVLVTLQMFVNLLAVGVVVKVVLGAVRLAESRRHEPDLVGLPHVDEL